MKAMKAFVSTAVALVAVTSMAKTVAWYHLDGTPGAQTTGADGEIVNAVDPTKGAGYTRTWTGNKSAYWNAPTIAATPVEQLPCYTNGFEGCFCVYDPVAHEMRENHSAIYFKTSDPTKGHGVLHQASLLIVPDDASFHSTSLTLEFYAKIPNYTLNASRTIMCYTDAGGNAILSIGLGKDDGYFTASAKTTGGSVTKQHRDFLGARDDKWHHFALVVDGTAKTLELFINGVGSGTVSFTGDLDFTDAKEMIFGGSRSYTGVWEGAVDEIRLSDTALAKTEFLTTRFHDTPSAVAEDETLFYADFSGSMESTTAGGFWKESRTYVPALLNKAKLPAFEEYPIEMATFEWSGQTVALSTRASVTNVPGEHVRAGLAAEPVTNAAACWMGQNVDDTTAKIPRLDIADTGRMMVSNSFTLEFFCKVGTGDPTVDGSDAAGYIVSQSATFQLRMEPVGIVGMTDGADNYLYIYTAWNTEHKHTAVRYNDGKWHHYAIVYDEAQDVVELYIDYQRKGHLSHPNFLCPFGNNDLRQMSFFGYTQNKARRFRDATIDELRITRGALPTWRFLTTRAVEAGGLGSAAYDANFAMTPYADFFAAPVAAAFTDGGAAPTLSAVRPAAIILDRKDGTPIRDRNLKSAAFDGGFLTYPDHGLVAETEESTVEFFLRTTAAEAGAGILKLKRADATDTNAVSWALSYADAAGNLALTVDTEAGGVQNQTINGAFGDGKWHHVALVFARSDANAVAKVYCDGVLAGTMPVAGRIRTRFRGADIVLGAGAEGKAFRGNVDEVRFTAAALEPESFMTPEYKGLLLFVR